MKKVLSVTAIIAMTVALILIANNNKTEETSEELIPIVASDITYEIETLELDPVEIAIKEMQTKMNEIESIEDNMGWFIAHKAIIAEYEGILDPPETIYDYFSEEEIYLIQRAVETETFDQDFMSKANVASVILNRIENGNFGETVEEVITTENQFAYGRKNITESTVLAVEFSFMICDTTNGCIGFRSDKKPQVWNGWEYSHTDDAGHHLYREKKRE